MNVEQATVALYAMSRRYRGRAHGKAMWGHPLDEIALDYWFASLLFPMEAGLRAELESKQ